MGGFSLPTPANPTDLQAQQNAAQQAALNNNRNYSTINQQGPFGGTTWERPTDGSPWTQTQTMDPRILAAYYNDLQAQQNLRGVANNALAGTEANIASGFKPSGLNPLQNGVNFNDLPGMVSGGNMEGLAGWSDKVNSNPFHTGFSREGFIDIPGANGFSEERQKVEDAMFGNFSARADRRFGNARNSLESKLRNQGLTPGTQAYADASKDLSEQENDAYAGAARDATLAGGAEQSRMQADALRIRGQQESEGMNSYGMFNQGNAQNFGQNLQSGMFSNSMRGQDYNERMGNAAFNNQAQGQGFNQMLANQQFGNQARGQGYNEQLTEYKMPFDVFNAMYKPSNLQMPNMGSGQMAVSNGGTGDPTKWQQMMYGNNSDEYNRNMALAGQGINFAQNLPWKDIANFFKPSAGGGGGSYPTLDLPVGFADNYEMPFDYGMGLDPLGAP